MLGCTEQCSPTFTSEMSTMTNTIHYEAEVLPGLEPFAAGELRATLGRDAKILKAGNGRVPFELDAGVDSHVLGELRTVNSNYRVLTFDVPRPKGLLGHQAFTAMTTAAKGIIGSNQAFRTLSLDAAGADSAVMQRIKSEFAAALRLTPADDKGDLHVRIRPAPDKQGWQVLLRLTPRPLVTRPWRQHNFQGALNAAAASVMASLTAPQPDDRIINLMCGSGTLLIERAALGPYAQLTGVDSDPTVLGFAQDHLNLSQTNGAVLVCADVRHLPYPAVACNVLLADLPFGQLVGSHRENVTLYPAVLAEAGRITTAGARFALITHEKHLIGEVLRAQSVWSAVRTVPINLNGLHPEILLLEKQG
jgi:tRNA (guanine6-N2)-methyltransferase